MFFDPILMLISVPGLLLSMWASFKVKTTFRHYGQVRPRSGLSGAEAARELLRQHGVADVRVEPIEGFLSDHYDPQARVLRLSPDVYSGCSLAALGVAAHEAGHALQHAADYKPLSFRSLVVKPAMFGSQLGMYAVFAGLMLHATGFVWVGVIMFSAFVLFTLVTLPVEFDASRRAVAVLADSGMIAPDEVDGTRKVLSAAALTYVAAAITAVLQLLYFLWRAGLLGSRRQD
jgi:Zn-dependent membrane protease YugP